jgi:peptide/nickel transport system substrate-binding protein
VAAWIPGFGVTLSAFKDYVLGPPGLGRIEVRFFADRRAVLDALRHDEVDVAPSPALEADLSRTLDRIADGTDRTGLQAYYTPAEALDVLRFGPSRFADARTRHAVELAVDRQAIVDDVFAGRARVPASYLVPPLWAAAENTPAARPDRESARALLAAVGFVRGNFGILQLGGERMTVTLLVASGSAARIEAARRVAGDLAAIGIAAEVRERPLAELAGPLARGDFDLALVPQRADDPDVATEGYRGLAGPWFDTLAAAARATADRGEKRALYVELQRLWTTALPALPLYQHLQVDVAPRRLAGVQPSPAGDALTWSARDWRFGPP